MRNVFKWHLLNQWFKFKIILQKCSSWCPLPKLLNSMATRAKNKNIFERYLYCHWPIHYILMNEDSDERSRALLLAHLSRRLMGSLLYTSHSGVRPLSVRPQFQTSSLKPLGQLNSNFIWRLLRTQGRSLFKWSWSHDQDGRHAHIW